MNDKQVPGNPSLEIHGSLEPVQGGSRFDGTKSSLSGQLPGTACVCDPDMCISGFALGAKLKFSDMSLTSNVPQYVIDTGASANNKGVSVFLQLNSLYFKIVNSNAVYQVRLLGQTTHSLYLSRTSLSVWPEYSHYRPPSQFPQTGGSTSWETSAGRLDCRSILMVSWWTEMYWGRTEIT